MKKIFFIILTAFCLSFSQDRIVVLDPASIETLFMLGAEKNIVGIAPSSYANIYPEEKTSKLPNVGSFSHPSLEKIVSLKPSLVILSSYSLNLAEVLKDFGIKSLYMQAQNLKDMKANVTTLAKIVGKEKEGQKLIKDFEGKLQALHLNPLNKSAIYIYSSNPLMVFSDNSLIADIFRLIGVKNLSPKSKIQRFIISAEYILKKNPEILVFGMGIDKEQLLQSNPLLKNTKANKTEQIYYNPNTALLLRLSPKITERIKEFKENLRTGTF